jgi:hypothetical protein
LQQGDVLDDVPFFLPYRTPEGALTVPREGGAALLITENCQLDKRTSSGKRRPDQRLQWRDRGSRVAAQDWVPRLA